MSPSMFSASTLTFSLLSLLASAASVTASGPQVFARQSNETSTASDPNDPKNTALGYIPSNVSTTIALVLILSVAITQCVLMIRHGGRCMLSMLIGEFTWAAGFAVRYLLHNHGNSKGIYIAFDLLDVLSPCAFIATDYMILGRIATHLNCQGLLFIRPERIAKVFVISDITTVFVQAIGASMTASDKQSAAKLGKNILLVGLIIQLVSFGFFIVLFFRFLFGVRQSQVQLWVRDSMKPFLKDWRAIAGALVISCLLILLRSIYRVIEFTQGYKGPLSTNEATFYLLDTLPLFIAVAVYVPMWPTRVVPTLEKPNANGAGAGDRYELGNPKGGY